MSFGPLVSDINFSAPKDIPNIDLIPIKVENDKINFHLLAMGTTAQYHSLFEHFQI